MLQMFLLAIISSDRITFSSKLALVLTKIVRRHVLGIF